MIDICSDYGNRFGGRSPSHFVVNLNEAPVPYVVCL